MKYQLILLVSLLGVLPLLGQQSTVTEAEETTVVEMTPEELQSIVRRLAVLRQRRIALLQRRYAARPAPVAQAPPAATRTDTVYLRPEVATAQNATAEMRAPRTDTVYQRTESTVTKNLVAEQRDLRAELADIRDRLDRQERLLRNRDTTIVNSRRDTIVQRIFQEQQSTGDPLDRDELRILEREMNAMNATLEELRNELRYERSLRRDAENQLSRNERDYRNNRNDLVRNAVPNTVIVPTPEPRIIRDTVYVKADTVTPVFIPTPPQRDTVTIIREVTAEPVVRVDTVRERIAIVERDTVREAAREPIAFPTIFFGNNASTLSTAHRQLLSTTARELTTKTGYIVRITGFASPSGNAEYNEQLSAKRAGAVRQGLQDLGVAADRIRIVPGGIDYQPASAAAARRVEIQALPQ